MLRDAKDFKKAMLEAKHELEIEVARPVMPPIRSEPAAGAGGTVAAPPAPAPATRRRGRTPRRPTSERRSTASATCATGA